LDKGDVLIVDDDRQVREVLHQIFLSGGYNCIVANDGTEGLALFQAVRPSRASSWAPTTSS
jgi:CheY-like chemotaxis protein